MRRSSASATFAVALSLCTVGLPPAHVRADGVADEAEADFRMAVARFQASDYEGALAWFMASNRLAPNPNVQFNIARTFDALSRLPEAHRWYQDALATAATDAQRAEIRAALDRLEARVAIVEVRTSPPGATVYLDRRELGSVARTPARIAVPPGEHRVIVELEGHAAAEPRGFTATIGRSASVDFELRRIVGHVDAAGEPGTALYVDRDDGDPACTLPCSLDLEPGVHTLRGRREGFRFDPVTVRVVADTRSAVAIEGRMRTGSLVVTTDERDATVEIDGQPAGFTPAVLPNVPVGERRVIVRLEGYEPLERTVTIDEGSQAELRDLRLVPERTVTTASRVAEAYDDSSASISVITAHELEAFRYPNIAEALRGQRGVSITYDTAYHSIGVRGLGQPNDYGNRVLVLQDGAVLNDNLLYQSFTGFDGRVDLGDVQRIEFVRGPGSVLYGTGAVSGLVNLIQHSADRPTSADVTVSTYGDFVGRARAHVHARIGDGGGFDASVSGAYGDGRTVNVSDGASGTTRVPGVDRFNAVSSAGAVRIEDFRLQWLFARRDQQLPAGVYETIVGDPGTYFRDTRAMLEARYEPRLGDRAQLFLRLAGNLYRFASVYRYDDGAGGVDPSREVFDGQWLVGEARFVLRPVSGLQIVAGTEVQASVRARLRGRADSDPDRYLDASNPYQIFSAYALAEYAVSPRVRFSAGVRADVWNTATASFSPPYALSPRVAAIFRPWDGGVLKLMAGRAFRAPSSYELLYDDGGVAQVQAPSGSLAPESVWSSEVELTHRFSEDWVVLGSAHFQQARDFIETRPAGLPPPDDELVQYENAAENVLIVGGDLELRKEWRDGWLLAVNYGYLRSTYSSVPDEASTGSRRVPNQPEHFGSARTVVPMGRSGVELAFRATLEGSRRISLDSNATTGFGTVVDLVLSGKGWEDRLTWAFGVYDLLGWRRSLPVGDILASGTLRQSGRSLFAEVRLAY